MNPMAAEYDYTEEFRGASFFESDFTGARFRGCDLSHVKIAGSWLADVGVDGLVGRFVVNDVDVTDFVEAELDRRHPERAQVQAMQTPEDYRRMWAIIEQLWSSAVARAE